MIQNLVTLDKKIKEKPMNSLIFKVFCWWKLKRVLIEHSIKRLKFKLIRLPSYDLLFNDEKISNHLYETRWLNLFKKKLKVYSHMKSILDLKSLI